MFSESVKGWFTLVHSVNASVKQQASVSNYDDVSNTQINDFLLNMQALK